MKRWAWLVPVLLAVPISATSALGAASHSRAVPFKYVALGDSFSAGDGVAPYLRDGFAASTGRQGVIANACHRSSRAYPASVKRPGDAKTVYAIASGGKPANQSGVNKYGSEKNVRSAGGVSWASWACSGATTKNVLPKRLGGVPQSGIGRTQDRRTQLDSASLAGASLVTITIGGNDVGFVDSLLFCAVGNCNTRAFERERKAIIDKTQPKLEKVYRAIVAKAPRARILVLGYPQVFPATEAEQACPQLGLFAGEQTMLRDLGAHLNDTIEAAVRAVAGSRATIEFVPTANAFAGHEVCGQKGAWIYGAMAAVPAHPNALGHRKGFASVANAALRATP